ncbi:MAG TPA: M48 family metalloprotease, partial [Telluria sp.]
MRTTAHRLAVLAAFAALAGHASLAIGADPAPPEARIPSVIKVGELPPPPPHEWADLQADLNDKRVAGNGLVSMPALELYLNGLYAAMKRSAGVPDWPGGVHIIADSTLNAAASASGNIYLHMGFIRSAETEDEIFAVLAHEFAHVYLNHQAAYEAHVMAANARFGLNTLLLLAKKKLPGAATGWGVFDSVALAGTVAHEAVIPVWQRAVEEQADMFGATLALRNNYSYPAGFKTFLERLASVEKEDAERLAALASASAQATGAAPASPRKTHADAVAREAALTEQVKPLLPRPRPAARKQPWQAALKERATAEVLAHFALLLKIEQLQASNRNADALKLAQNAASGASYGDATMVLTLADAMRRTG